MLPEEVIALTQNYVCVFDSEHVPESHFRKIGQGILEELLAQGLRGGAHAASTLYELKNRLTQFLEEKARFIFEKLQQVIQSTDIEPYPELRSDIGSFILTRCEQTATKAQKCIDDWLGQAGRQQGQDFIMQNALTSIITKLEADIALFCTKYATMKKKQTERQGTTIIYNNLQGPNPRVNIDSTDLSVNIANSEKIFSELRKAIEDRVEDRKLKEQLVASALELEGEVGKPSYFNMYQKFVALAANHMDIVGPFIPAVTKFFGS